MPRDFGPKPPPGWPADRPWPPTSKADVSYLSLLGRDITHTSQGLAHAIKAVPGLAKEYYDYAQAHPIRAGLELIPPVALGEMAGEVYKKGREGKIDLPNAGMLAMAGVAHVPVLSKLPKFRSAAIKLADGRVFEGALHFNAVEDAMSAMRNGRPFKSGAERVRAVDKALAGATSGFTDEAGHFLNDQQASQRLVKMGHKAFSEGGRVATEEIPRKAWAGGAPGAAAKEPLPRAVADSAVVKGVPAVRNLLTSFQRPDAINLPRVSAVDKTRGAQMAKAYEGLPKNDPAAAEAYRTLNAEVEDQFKAMQKAGYKVEFVDHDPYKNSAEMMADVRDNKTLKVFKTGEGQQHPFMTAEQNNKFRAVHDWLAHAGEGHSFSPKGEENAYRVHASTLSPLARRALATETRGQNSWVNFGPNAHLPVTERPFAEQKAALFPEELTGDYSVMDKSAILTGITMPRTLKQDSFSRTAASSHAPRPRKIFKDAGVAYGRNGPGDVHSIDVGTETKRNIPDSIPLPRKLITPPAAVARKSTTPHTTGWLDGYTHVEYDTPHGPIKVLYKNLDTDGNLSIESIDTPALDAGANTRGPTVMRAIANDLQQSTGASTVSGNRISGMAPDRQVRRALRPDSLWNLLWRPRE